MHEMNERRPDLNLLAVFDAVAACGSVTGAAERLALSQPAVSHALNRLRDLIGDPLFVRGRRGLQPTPRAEAMRAPVREILAASSAILAGAPFAPESSERRFRVGVSDYASLTLVPPLIRALRTLAPRATFETRAVGPTTFAELEGGELDCAFWGADPPGSRWRAARLFSERLIGVIADDHPLARRVKTTGAIGLDDYLAFPHVVVSIGARGANPVDLALAALGRSRAVAVVTQSFAANMEALHGSDLIASVPSRLTLSAQPGLSVFELPLALADYDYTLLWHARTDADSASAWLRAEIGRVAASQPGRESEGAGV